MAETPSELQFEIEKLERKHAEHPEGRFFVPLANAYRKMGDVETAEALLRAGVERHPDYLSAHIVLGRCLADRGATSEAEEEFRFVLTEDPQNLIALRTLGELALADARPNEAADWYRELLAVDPMNEEARQALDSLSDAPASTEVEAEFRAGAGWWEAQPDATGDAPGDTRFAGSPSDADDGSSEVVTETIAELYARQGLHDRAASVYRELIRRRGGDQALEQRLAELERRIRVEAGGEPDVTAVSPAPPEPASGAGEQDESWELAAEPGESRELAAEPEEDPFAASFADGFTLDAFDEPAAEATTGDEIYLPPLLEVEAHWSVTSALEAAAAAAGEPAGRTIDPSQRTSIDEASVQPAAHGSSRQTIADFLSDLASWRPRAATAPALDPDLGSTAVTTEGSAVPADSSREAGPTDEVAAGAVFPAPDEDAGQTLSAPAEVGETEYDSGAGPDPESLPFLEEVTDQAATFGTGSAEEEPFPWELPGESLASTADLEGADEPAPLDSFYTEEQPHEPETIPADERVPVEPTAAAAPEAPAPGSGAAAASTSDDEDLESFQAWLRSLKR